MKIALFFISVFTFSVSFSQFTSTPCLSGPLPNSCANNTVNLTSAFTNSGVTNPSVENGVGCNSVGSNITAGTIGHPSSGNNAYDGWFTTTADAAGVVDVYAAIVTGDPVVGIYSGPCTALTLITCDDDGGTGLDANATATGLTPGATYWVRVWDYAGGTGTYEITSNNGTPPANDNCVGAQGLTLNGAPVGGTNYCSTVETSDWNDCENNTENNVWYSFTTTADGDITVNFGSIDCFGSGQGIDVSVFYGNCASFASYGCTAVNAGSTGSIPQFYGPAGTYYVMVDGNNSGGTTALCTFNVDVDFVGCPANAGTNTSPALITVCAGTDYNPTATGTTNTNIGANPCIGWGFWVADDPLNQFPGMTGIGNLPTGNNPAGSAGDPNYAGVFTSTTFPLANGETPTLPWEGNGVTYYIAPITLSNCATGEITTNCFDIGNVTQVYQNPQINTNFVIDCFSPGAPSTYVAIAAAGGAPIVDGSSFTVTNLGDGILDITGGTGNNVTFYVDDVPNGGTVSVLITDASGCSETVTIGPIDATAYCPACGANVGDVNTVQTGSGVTQTNNGINGSPFVLCFGDDLDLSHITSSATIPPDINLCGNSPTDFTVPGSCNPGIVYGIFTGLSTFANPFDDPINFSGFGFATDDINFLNNGFWIQTLINNGIPVVNNTFWLYPVTAQITGIDLNGDGNLNWSEDPFGDGCLDSGSPIAITMLNQIVGTTTNLCDGPEITITGGNPEFFGGNYLVTNNAGGTITGLPVTHNGSITITGLNDGDPYNINITDNNGCTINVSGTYNYTQPVLSLNNLASEFCLNDPADAFDVTPIPLTVTTGSFDIDFVSDGYCNEWSWVIEDAFGVVVGSGNTAGCALPSGTALATITVGGLNPANGPFTFIINDSFGDGQDSWGLTDGSTTITNNITGQVVGFISGNWGATTTLNLGNFVSTTVTIGGTNVVDNGDGTAVFTPSTVGSHTIGFIYDNGEGCTYTASQVVTVHPNPLLSSVINPTICANETILLSDFSPGEANGVPGTGTWYVGNNSSGATAPTTAFTPVNGAQYFYEYVATAGGCSDDRILSVTVNPLPATPTITSTAPTCIADGASTISNYNAALTYVFNPTGPTVGAGGVISGMSVGTSYTVTAGNGTCTSLASASFSNAVMLTTPAVPTITSTAPTCSANGSSTVSNYNAALTYVFSPTGPTVGAGGVISGMTVGTSYTVTAGNGSCTSVASASFSNAVMLTTPAVPTIASTAPTCIADGSSEISNYDAALTYTFNPTGPTVGAGGAISGMTVGTSYTVTAGNGSCTSVASASFSNAVMLTTPAVPTIASTAPTCSANGSSTVSNYNAALTYVFNPTGPTVGAGGVISGMTVGTSYTVTAGNGSCTSVASASFSNAVMLTTPAVPTIASTAPTCIADGSSEISNYDAALTYTFNPTGPTVGAGGVISGMTVGTSYTVTAGNGTCTSLASASFSNAVMLTTPAVPTIASTAPTCSAAGASTVSNYNAVLTYTFSPTGPTVGAGGVISGTTVGTSYTVTAGNGTCTSLASASFSNAAMLTTPAVPTIASTAPTCSANGSSTVSNYNAALTYVFNPTGPTVGAGGAISGMTVGTSYTVTAGNGSCTSVASASFSNAVMLTTPAVPTIASTAPTCSAAGASTVSNYNAVLTYTFSPTGPTVGAGGVISGMTVGTSYTVTAGNGSCTSVASASFSNAAMLTTPDVPTIASTAPTCIADGSSEISNYDAALTYTFNPTGPTVGAGGAISGMTVGTSYTVTAGNGSCTSVASASFSNAVMLTTPAVTASANTPCIGQPLTLSGGANGLTYSWSGPNVYASTSQNPTVSSSASSTMAGTYTLTVSNGTCTNSTTVAVTINSLPTLDVSGIDIQNPTNCGDTDGSIIGIVGSGAATLSYSWNGGTSQPTEDLTGVGSGSYTLVVTDGNGCSNSEGPFTISDPTPPAQPTITLDPGAVCVGGSFTISVNSPDGAATYAWSGPGGYTNTGTSITLINITTANSGNYTVTPTVAGCTGNTSAPVNVTVNTLPNVDVLPPLVVSCDNPIITLDGSNSDQTNTTFSWSVANGGVIIGSGNTDTETTSTPGDYELVVTNTITQCTNSEIVSVVDNFDTPIADVSSTNGGLIDCINTSLVLDGTGSTNDAGGTTGIIYTWSNTSGGTSIGSASTFTANAAGDYYLLVEETISGCTDEVMITITADANIPTALIDAPNTLTCAITTVTLDGSNSLGSPLTYEWTDASSTIVGSNSTLDVTTPGQYTLEVTNTDNNCTNTVSVTVNEDVTVPSVSVVSPLVVSCNVPDRIFRRFWF
jgi:hypothetical protein